MISKEKRHVLQLVDQLRGLASRRNARCTLPDILRAAMASARRIR
jgi:hypothetical protein